MSHRELTLDQLNKYKVTLTSSVQEDELRIVEKCIRFISENPDCFERSNRIAHVNGSALLLNKDEGKVLLMHHKKLDKWLPFGGHADGDHSMLYVAIKETKEESGIKNIGCVSEDIFDVSMNLIDKGADEAHYHYDITFLLKVKNNENFTQNKESNELCWFSKEDLQNLVLEDSVKRIIKKWNNNTLLK